VASQRLKAREIRNQLEELIAQANSTEPKLAQRLRHLESWIANRKDGLLNSKPYVLDLLVEVILDSRLWLNLKPLSSAQKQDIYSEMNITPAQQYWFDVLFTRWVNERDPKLPLWKQQVMAGNFNRDDEPLLRLISQEIKKLGGSCLWRHILDLSMATDLMITGLNKLPLGIQLTTVSGKYLKGKQSEWEKTLIYWKIKRGLLVSYNPASANYLSSLINLLFVNSDSLPSNCYNVRKV
jgi:hypothetical protein